MSRRTHLLAFWLVFAAAMIVYLMMVMGTLPAIQGFADGLPAFDMRPLGYSADEARAFLSALTAEGLDIYTGRQKTLDTIYPALLSLTLILAFLVLLRPGVLRGFALILALGGAVFDYLENRLVAGLLATDPSVLGDSAIASASRATLLKSGFVTLSMLLLLALTVRVIWQKWTTR